jgi:hypothetical protein
MTASDLTLKEILQRIHDVEGKLDVLLRRLTPLLDRLEQAEDTLTHHLALPKDFNEGPHLPGLG